VSTTHLIRKHKKVRVLLQLRVAFAIHPSGKDDAGIARGFQRPNVVFLPRIVAHDNQLSVGNRALERAYKKVDVVFGNEATNKQDVIPLAQSEAVQNVSLLRNMLAHAIYNAGRIGAKVLPVVAHDFL